MDLESLEDRLVGIALHAYNLACAARGDVDDAAAETAAREAVSRFAADHQIMPFALLSTPDGFEIDWE